MTGREVLKHEGRSSVCIAFAACVFHVIEERKARKALLLEEQPGDVHYSRVLSAVFERVPELARHPLSADGGLFLLSLAAWSEEASYLAGYFAPWRPGSVVRGGCECFCV